MIPLLSIVIANYNYGRFLEAAIRSVIMQDKFEECELIIVDGGSTDNSVEVIRKYEDKIAWWVSEKDKGQSDAFNKGFAKARGKYLTWLNADDLMFPRALSVVLTYLENDPDARWIAGSTIFIDKDSRVVKCSRCVREFPMLMLKFPNYSINGPSSFFRKDDLADCGGFDLTLHYSMDTDLWRRFAARGIKLHHVKEYLWCFRLHETSKTSHKLITGKGSATLNAEGRLVNMRYGVTPIRSRIGPVFNRLGRLFFGAYLCSYLDTLKFKGMKIDAGVGNAIR